MKVRKIKKRSLKMMQHFLQRHWNFFQDTSVRQVFQNHHNFMMRIHK